jgi:DNA-binding transcriptional LysR family regulator
MELRHLRYVVAVADELHFGRAANKLNMSQPPLSQAIRRVEDELGVALFHRTKRSVELTEAGKTFVAGAREVISQAERTAASAIAASRGEVGELVVATITSTDSGFYKALVTILRTFSRENPMVHLRLRQLNVAQQIEHLHASKIHVAFVTLPVLDSRLAMHVVHREPLAIAMPEDHPLAKHRAIPVRALADEPHVLMPRQSNAGYYDFLTGYFRKGGVTLRVSDESDGIYTSLALVAARRGISVLPLSVLEINRPGIVMRPFQGSPPMMEMGAVYLKDAHNPVLDRFIDVTTKYIEKHHRSSHIRHRSPKTRTSTPAG